MSAATEYAPVLGAPFPAPCPPRGPRHLHAVPDAVPVRVDPSVAAIVPAGVTVLHAPGRVAPAAAPLRLTRRGLVVVAAVVAVLAGGLLWLAAASAPSAPSAASAHAAAPAAVTVEPGDTLWSIASRVAPDRDPRAEVDALQRANHLTGVDLVPGQHLRVP